MSNDKKGWAVSEQRGKIAKLLDEPNKVGKLEIKTIDDKSTNGDKKIHFISDAYTTGSTAASGSSDFHIIKAARRRRYESEEEEKILERNEKEASDFERKRIQHMKRDEAKTEKNRKRRKRRNTGKKENHEEEKYKIEKQNKQSSGSVEKTHLLKKNSIPESSDIETRQSSSPVLMRNRTDNDSIDCFDSEKDADLAFPAIKKPNLSIIDEPEF